jgi:hypothetical protein
LRYDFDVHDISRNESLAMIRTYHYSDTLPKINRHYLGCFIDGQMVGTLTLGLGTRPRHTIQCLFPSLDTGDYYEIGRMCMTDDMPRNSESQMLSAVVKWIRANEPNIKVLFTWADGIMGKPGYVYQASSFLYAGCIESEIYLRNGVKLHVRGMKPLLVSDPRNDKRITVRPTLEQMRELGIEHYKGMQYRYVKFTCGKRERRRLMQECKVELGGGYPKTSDLRWRRKDTITGKWEVCAQPHVITDSHNEGPATYQPTLF